MRLAIDPSNRVITDKVSSHTILPEHHTLIADTTSRLVKALSPDLASIYLYGGVVQWHITPGLSDLDVLLFYKDKPSPTTIAYIKQLEKELSEAYEHTFAYIGLEIIRPELLHHEEPQTYSLVINNLSVHLRWEEITDLPPAILWKDLWGQINRNSKARIEEKFELFKHEEIAIQKKLQCRRIMKKLLRISFALIMDSYTHFMNDITELADILSQQYPDRTVDISRILQLAQHPTCNVEEVEHIMESYFPRLLQERKKVYPAHYPL